MNIMHLLIYQAKHRSLAGDRFLSLCTHLYSVFQVETKIVYLLICHAQEIAFSQCVLTLILCVSGSDERSAPVDLSRSGDRFLSVCTHLDTVCFRLRRT